ncbi:amidohydrolase [Nonomuraea sp. MTCD27]|uniref:amidohydrolase family protein n=1 Tax=Nonomuraea sp. MTCD27 TaxID=1676747 RepID=UPI0035C23C86
MHAYQVLDSHVHLLSARKAAALRASGGPPRLSRPWDIPDLVADWPGPARAIVMDSDRPFPGENERLLDVAAAHPAVVAGVIGRLELAREDFAERLARIERHPAGSRWRGPRLALRPDISEPWTPALVADRTAALGAGGRVLELLAPSDRLDEARLVAEAAQCAVVVDHLGCPPWLGPEAEWQAWEEGIAGLGSVAHVVTKLSDLPEPGGDERIELRIGQAIALAHELFGDGRLMYASNWPWPPPAGTQQEPYARRRALEYAGRLSPAAAAAFFGGTAARVFMAW